MSGQERSGLRRTNHAAFENFLMAKYERLAGVAKTRSYPYIMTIDPCNICQLRCPSCFTGMSNEMRRKHKKKGSGRHRLGRLPGGVLDSILEECGDVVFYCHFYNWGEPLLNENLADYIRCAHEREIFTKIDTNLSLKCSDEMLEDVMSSGLDVLSASIDGFSLESYEQYRIGGRLDLALENLEKLVEIRARLGSRTTLRWKYLIFAFNEHEVGKAAQFCAARGIEFLPADAVITNPAWTPTYRREGKPNPFRIARTAPEFTTPAGRIPLYPGRPEGKSCGWHYSYTTVNADGGVLPCCGLIEQKFNFGRVAEEPGSFGEIWNNENFANVRRNFPAGTETSASGPTTACTRCTRPATMLDHYASLDREIIVKYWSLDESARRLDALFTLLQKSPSKFAEAYAERYQASSHGLEQEKSLESAL
jgi:radical SAM protein with 4Fe4S-binding SPASM domain